MPTILLYAIKLSCSLGLIWLFYRLVLRNLTFYTANRWYLVGYSLLCFLIPLINIGPIYREDPTLQPLIFQYIPVIGKPLAEGRMPVGSTFSWLSWNSLMILLAVGSFLLLARFVVRCLSLRRIRRKGVLLQKAPIAIYLVDERIAPFSWGKAVYINRQLHSDEEWAEIILHEYVHIRQRHYLDILVSEALTVLNWYNPFAWLIRYSIRQNLEFIADRTVVEKGVDKKGYQFHLLKVVGQNGYRLANNFNFSSLKKRIIMMNKMRSARLHVIRFLFILPLLAVLLVAFRDRYEVLWHRTSGPVYANIAGIVFDINGRAPISGAVVRDSESGLQGVTDDRGFYKFQVPVNGGSVRLHLDVTKAGYEPTFAEWRPSSKNVSFGVVSAFGLWDGVHRTGGYMGVPYMKKVADDPGYADALLVWKYELKWNDDYKHFTDMKKAHPEVSLFYTSEGMRQQVVVKVDGTVERYGYPGGPTIADMEKKYGVLPDFMKASESVAGSGYLDRWAAISAQAEKEFRPTTAVRAIVFPGDSRVIVVPVSGKPRFYDMDSDQPEERPAFEQAYGQLPDCVPPPYQHKPIEEASSVRTGISALSVRVAAKAGDTVPARDASPRRADTAWREMRVRPDALPGEQKLQVGGEWGKDTLPRREDAGRSTQEKVESLKKLEPSKVLWIVDGKERPGLTMDSIPPQDIAAMDVFKGERAVELFGSKAANGVVAVITKRYQRAFQAKQDGGVAPLFIVNDREEPANILQVLTVSRIASINVLTDSAAAARYGDKGKHGVISITLKNE